MAFPLKKHRKISHLLAWLRKIVEVEGYENFFTSYSIRCRLPR